MHKEEEKKRVKPSKSEAAAAATASRIAKSYDTSDPNYLKTMVEAEQRMEENERKRKAKLNPLAELRAEAARAMKPKQLAGVSGFSSASSLHQKQQSSRLPTTNASPSRPVPDPARTPPPISGFTSAASLLDPVNMKKRAAPSPSLTSPPPTTKVSTLPARATQTKITGIFGAQRPTGDVPRANSAPSLAEDVDDFDDDNFFSLPKRPKHS
jgi:hypothetical protein